MQYEVNNNIATLSFDDGKASVVGQSFLNDINAGLDRAEKESVAAVILRGREGMFSAGFDLGEFKKGPERGIELPPILLELTASRISRRHMTRVALLSEVYNPEQAVHAGFVGKSAL